MHHDSMRRALAEAYLVLVQYQHQRFLGDDERQEVLVALNRLESLLEITDGEIGSHTWFRILGSRAFFAALRVREESFSRPREPQPVVRAVIRGNLRLVRSA